MTTAASTVLPLNDGRSIPQLGLGTYKAEDAAAAALVREAVEVGYRHVDTASMYHNERGVGEGVKSAGVPREELFVTTKVWNDQQGYDETLRAFDESLRRLGLDYVDLYLIHWPAPAQDRYVDTWRALEKLRADGVARSIGVSNFEPHHIDRIRQNSETLPAVNQVELHPWLPQVEVRAFGESLGIVTESWSPLARGRMLDDPILGSVAERHDKTPAQVVLRWHLQLGLVVIPKSGSPERVRENADIFDFELDADDLLAVASLETGMRTGGHPDD